MLEAKDAGTAGAFSCVADALRGRDGVLGDTSGGGVDMTDGVDVVSSIYLFGLSGMDGADAGERGGCGLPGLMSIMGNTDSEASAAASGDNVVEGLKGSNEEAGERMTGDDSAVAPLVVLILNTLNRVAVAAASRDL